MYYSCLMYFLELLFWQKRGRQRIKNTSFGMFARTEYYIRPKHLFSSMKWEYNKQASIKRNLINKKVLHINVSSSFIFHQFYVITLNVSVKIELLISSAKDIFYHAWFKRYSNGTSIPKRLIRCKVVVLTFHFWYFKIGFIWLGFQIISCSKLFSMGLNLILNFSFKKFWTF